MYIAVISSQRSSSGLFARMLGSHPQISCQREVFHGRATGLGSFFEFCLNHLDHAGFVRLNARTPAFQAYLRHVSAETGRPNVGFIADYAHCHQLNGDNFDLDGRPALLNFMVRNDGAIVHIVSRNALAQAATAAIARSSGGAKAAANEIRTATEALRLEPTDVIAEMDRAAAAVAVFERHLEGLPRVLTVEQETMFDGEGFRPDLLAKVAETLGVAPRFNAAAGAQRAVAKDWREQVENWREIEQAAASATPVH